MGAVTWHVETINGYLGSSYEYENQARHKKGKRDKHLQCLSGHLVFGPISGLFSQYEQFQ